MTPHPQTVTEIEQALNLLDKAFAAYYEALKCFIISKEIEECDWIERDENEGYQSNSYYEIVSTRTIYVPFTNSLDYFPDKPTIEF